MTNLYKEIIINFFLQTVKVTVHSWRTLSTLLGSSVEIKESQQHQIDDMGWCSSHNAQNYKIQRVLCHMGDICLLGNTCKWNHCLNKNPCLHRTTMGTNKKVVYICIYLFDFPSIVFTSFRPNHWCKNCLGKGYLWNYILSFFQIIMGSNFD